MKEYIMLIITTSLLCGVIKLMSPKSSVSQELSFAIKIVMLCIIVSPVIKWSGDFIKNEKNSVIIEEGAHTINNEDAQTLWGKMLSENISEQIENELYNSRGVKTKVIVPYSIENGNVVFGIVQITAECDEKKCEDIENFINERYLLESQCKKGEVND